ncbi:FecR family protein [Sunxiuqinia sp. sy24]|uniref:FecR family protein n=1 Tax=Sunxiuqinia sp. sy24 TaxID=3461495 RepID=UPI004045AA03
MSNTEYEKIALLIAKEISDEISDEELQELNNWRNRAVANNSLYLKLKNSQNYKKWVLERENVKVEKGWLKVHVEIKKRSRMIFLQRIIRVAAILIVPLFIGGITYVYFERQIAENRINRQYAQIEPGSSKATLTLFNGRNVVLDSANTMSLTEIDGTTIEKKKGEISYSKSKDKTGDAMVYNTINVPIGGEYRLTLSDGTTVYLNSMTTLKYPVQFGQINREVELIGEAYFEVARNTVKPFIVNTKEMRLEVLGTSFNVNAYKDSKSIITTLVEGKVKLSHSQNGAKEQILNPNEQVVMDNLSGNIIRRKVDVTNYISWKDGQLVFHDMALEDIMVLLARWYSVKVFYMNPEVKSIRFSGSLDRYDEIRQFIDIIEATQKVKVEISNGAILFGKK